MIISAVRFIMMLVYIWFAKIITGIIRICGIGGATSLPGLAIEKFFPCKLRSLFSPYEKVVLITGTNGKTTTQKCLRHILELKGKKVVSNKSGANLIRGIISSLILDRNLIGKVKSDIGIFEVEEATMPILTKYIEPTYILVTNLFRDQLDVYGEIVKVRKYIVESIQNSPKSILFLNKDDPNVSTISSEVKNKVVYFNIRDSRKKDISYEKPITKAKIGKDTETVYAGRIKMGSDLSSEFNIYMDEQVMRGIRFESPGLQNVYNAVASIAVAGSMYRYNEGDLINAFSTYKVAFGRGEIIKVGNRYIRLLLVKNPVSFTANLNMLRRLCDIKLMIILNDNIADGTDVSWIWDARIEGIGKTNIASLTISGKRAYDMNVRFKYAEIDAMSKEVEPNISRALDLALSKLNEGETLYILPTYTAMLEVRRLIGNIVKIKKFWK